MGNQLTVSGGSADYANDLAKKGVYPRATLNSGRFLKTLHCDRNEDNIIVKVYFKRDSTSLKEQESRIFEIEQTLAMIQLPNVVPFSWYGETQRVAFITRQFFHTSLAERITTRPTLSLSEKRFFIFQLLKAVEQIHVSNTCHGDIKAENVMISSWGWLLLVDIASFKPTCLPEDNPADLSFFFDTSYDRRCYIAPERFVLDVSQRRSEKLKPEMDIFSLGCVLAELLMEGRPLFNLPQLLAYKNGSFDPLPSLEPLRHALPNAIDMIKEMISLNPNQRPSASALIERWRGLIYPPSHEFFLHEFVWRTSRLDADERVTRIERGGGGGGIIALLQQDHANMANNNLQLINSNSNNNFDNINNNNNNLQPVGEIEGLVIILGVVTSAMRNVRYPSSKIAALRFLELASQHVSDAIQLQRILPFSVAMLTDTSANVRCWAVGTMTRVVTNIRSFPLSESGLFPEYILPVVTQLSSDADELVRIALAENLPLLAEASAKFLEMAQHMRMLSVSNDLSPPTPHDSFDKELSNLHQTFLKITFELLTLGSACVKRVLLQDITRLCVFFGRERCNNEILPLLITILNDKTYEVRCAFFQNIVGVSAFVGRHALQHFVLPCILEALSDFEETVTEAAVNSLSCLCELGLIDFHFLLNVARVAAPLLVHPACIIRYSVVGLFDVIARVMGGVESHCRLIPIIAPCLNESLVTISSDELFASVKPPVSRAAFDMALQDCLAKDRERAGMSSPSLPPPISSGFDGIDGNNNNNGNSNSEWGVADIQSLDIPPPQTASLCVLAPYIARVSKLQLSMSRSRQLESESLRRDEEDEKWLNDEWNSFFGAMDEGGR